MEEIPRRRRRALPWALAAIALAAAGLVFQAFRDDTPPLTADGLAAAEARWQNAGLTSYEIAVRKKIGSAPAETLTTVVEGGRATQLQINGREVPLRDSYTVAGLFDLMARELEMRAERGEKPEPPRRVTLRARFEAETGLPIAFRMFAPDRPTVILDVERLEVPGRGQLYPGR